MHPEREKFEAWACKHRYWDVTRFESDIPAAWAGCYTNDGVESAWLAWQAASADKQAAVEAEREACASLCFDAFNIDMVGGSTGNAYGTAKRIAAAIRERGRK